MLGCGSWTAVIAQRGGTLIEGEVPFTTLSGEKVLDTAAEASITINPSGSNCCELIDLIKPWKHELHLYRDGISPPWIGPITTMSFTHEEVTINARDLFTWFERRWINALHEYTYSDLTSIFADLARDALGPDMSPNITFVEYDSGIVGGRAYDPFDFPRASDMLSDLAKDGINFTMVGRDLVIYGNTYPFDDLGVLVNESFNDIRFEWPGELYASDFVVLGTRSGSSPPYGRASDFQTNDTNHEFGLIQRDAQLDSIEDDGSAQIAAYNRLQFFSRETLYPSVTFNQNAQVQWKDLIPGATCRLLLEVGCKKVIGDYRMTELKFNVDNNGKETLTPTFVPADIPNDETG